MPVPTDIHTLDTMLDGGGSPPNTPFITVTPGTGKSTLAISFLKAGIDAGEDRLPV